MSGCGCNDNKQLSGMSGVGALFGGNTFGYLLVGTAAFLVGGKLQSGKWYWQKGKSRKKR